MAEIYPLRCIDNIVITAMKAGIYPMQIPQILFPLLLVRVGFKELDNTQPVIVPVGIFPQQLVYLILGNKEPPLGCEALGGGKFYRLKLQVL